MTNIVDFEYVLHFIGARVKNEKVVLLFRGPSGSGKSFASKMLSNKLKEKNQDISLKEKLCFDQSGNFNALFLFDPNEETSTPFYHNFKDGEIKDDKLHFLLSTPEWEIIEFVNLLPSKTPSGIFEKSEWKINFIKNLKDFEPLVQFLGNIVIEK